MYQSWGTPWPVVWPTGGPQGCHGGICAVAWWSLAACWNHPSSRGSGPLRRPLPELWRPREQRWKPSKQPANRTNIQFLVNIQFVIVFSNSIGKLHLSLSFVLITRSSGRCLLMRSLRLVLSSAPTDCLYCHFSGTKGHFICIASCRREASSAHRESTGNKSKKLCKEQWICWSQKKIGKYLIYSN